MQKSELQAYLFSRAPLNGSFAMQHGFCIVLVLLLGLILDAIFGIAGQIAVSIIVWSLMLYLLSRQTPAWRMTLIIGCAVALAAEMFFSLVLRWYDYRFYNIPPFVPPGHILLFMLGPPLARSLPGAALRLTPWLVASYGLYAGMSGKSTFDAALACIFLLAWQRKHSRPIYAAMLLLALALELWGTWLGNWVWQHQVPYSGGLITGNPPLLAGALYGLFDMFLMRLARRVHRTLGDLPQNDPAKPLNPPPHADGAETPSPDTIAASLQPDLK